VEDTVKIHRAWAKAARDVERRRAALAEVGDHSGPITRTAARCITFLRYVLIREA
jgi:hypothetical protein